MAQLLGAEIGEERRPLTRRADAAASPQGERLTERHLHLCPWEEVAAVCGGG
jgi:hypothetical protein